MESATRCPACRARIAAAVTVCPACGARLKKRSVKAATTEGSREAPTDRAVKPTKKKRKKARSGPNYPMIAALGGGVLVVGILVTFVVIGVQGFRKPAVDIAQRPDASNPGGPGAGPAVAPAPAWIARADPPKSPVRPKDNLSIPIQGDALFASGLSPFVADLVGVRSGVDNPPVISVHDLRTGERTLTAKAIREAQSPGRDPNGDFYVALGPEGKTLAALSKTPIKRTGRGSPSTANEALVYRLGKDEPVARIPLPQHLSWMEFGRDDDQLIVVSAPAGAGVSATAYDLKQKDQAGAIPLDIVRTGNRWRNGFRHPEAMAVSPGRTYLAVGEGSLVDLIQLSDGKRAGSLPVPGECVSVAFSPDGKELAVHSHTPPPRRGGGGVPTLSHWTTFSLDDGKQLTQTEVTGGSVRGPMLAAGPKPGLAVHHDRNGLMVADTRVGAPAYSAPFPAARYFDADHLVGYDAAAKRVAVHRIDPEQLAAGEKTLAGIFGPRPKPEEVDRKAVAKPTAPGAWAVPIDAAPNSPELVERYSAPDGADFLMPWPGRSALSAVIVQRVDTPRDRHALQWQRVDLSNGNAEPPVELWPSLLPPGQVPQVGSGSTVGDQTADGSRLVLRDAADPARIDVWDKSGKRLQGFHPYGPETSVEALAWASDNRLLTVGGGRVTGWEVPGPKAVFELAGYTGAFVLSPGRKWIAVQTDKYIDVFETATGKPLGRLAHANPANKPWYAFAVSRDGTRLAAVELVRVGNDGAPGIWGYSVWDLKTGMNQRSERIFAGVGNRPPHLMWIGPRLLLAGAADVIDLDARAVTATIGLLMKRPLPSPDGRFWAAQSDGRPGTETKPPVSLEAVAAIKLDAAINALPRLAFEDIVFREGVAVEAVSNTGDGARDAVIRSALRQQLAAEGYGTDRGQWRLEVTGQRVASGSTLDTPSGGKIQVPAATGWIRLLDPGGAEVWKGPLHGGWDMNQTRYKTHKEDLGPGPGGGSITHYNFGARDPGDAMAEEAWDNFVGGVRGGPHFPRVLARINGKLERLPVTVPAAGK